MAFSESLTVRILGDSSELQRELDSVLEQLSEFKTRISESSNSARQFSSSFGKLSQAIAPLRQVSSLIARIGQQLQGITSKSITLNVSPALQSLQQLTNAAQQTSAAIQAIPAVPSGSPTPVPTPIPNGGNGYPPRMLATGGLVTGQSGIDRVPARLTAGEYVVSKSAVEILGLGFLENLNSNPSTAFSLKHPSMSQATPPQSVSREIKSTPYAASLQSHQIGQKVSNSETGLRAVRQKNFSDSNLQIQSDRILQNNNFGGITIQVTDQMETESLMRSLELQGIGRRIRLG